MKDLFADGSGVYSLKDNTVYYRDGRTEEIVGQIEDMDKFNKAIDLYNRIVAMNDLEAMWDAQGHILDMITRPSDLLNQIKEL